MVLDINSENNYRIVALVSIEWISVAFERVDNLMVPSMEQETIFLPSGVMETEVIASLWTG